MPRKPLALRALPLAAATFVVFAACADSDELDPVSPSDDAGNLDEDSGTTPRPDASTPVPDAGSGDAAPPSRCGNGELDEGESCDDGNTVSGDGCSAECAQESAGENDLCPGQAIELTPDASGGSLLRGSVTGTTVGLYAHDQAGCGGGSAPDAVYRFTSPVLGRAKVRLDAQYAAVVAARSSCTESVTEVDCSTNTLTGEPGEIAIIDFPVYANTPFFLQVDGVGGASGAFTLEVEVDTAVCGNGIGEQPEGCDDGNTVDGDGCSSSCEVEDAAMGRACPGMGFRLAATPTAPGTLGFSGDLRNPVSSSSQPTITGCPASAGGNAVYAITPTVDGNLSLDLLANYTDASLHVHRNCANGSLVECRGASEVLTPLRASIAVRAEETIYAFVDSATSSGGGLYTLQAKLTTGSCGNGVIDTNEECDDGNQVDGDSCSSTCRVERNPASFTCPGQVVQLDQARPSVSFWGSNEPAPGESLPVNKFAPSACGSTAADVVYQVVSAFDGYLTARADATFNAALLVKSACTPGNTTTEQIACAREATGTATKTVNAPIAAGTPVYLIVDGAYAANPSGAFELELAVTPSVCGNGIREGGESCDDGNVASGDGCSATCQVEAVPAWNVCATAPVLQWQDAAGVQTVRVSSGNTNLTHTTGVPTAAQTLSGCTSAGADAWYEVVAPATGTIRARIPQASYNTTLGVRTGCITNPATSTQLACSNTAGLGGQEVVVTVEAGQRYFLVVDARNLNNDRGTYTLEANFLPAGCGDAIRTVDEQCDDGNVVDGDGCSSTCQLEAVAGLGSCPGHAITLSGQGSAPRTATRTIDTRTLTANVAGSCGGSGREAVMTLRSDIGGILQVRATRQDASYTPVLYTRTTCADPSSELQCVQGAGPSFSQPVVANQDYFLFLDGLAGQAGVAQLDITVTP